MTFDITGPKILFEFEGGCLCRRSPLISAVLARESVDDLASWRFVMQLIAAASVDNWIIGWEETSCGSPKEPLDYRVCRPTNAHD